MRKRVILTVLLLLAAFGGGCAQVGRYTRDRGNDLADCFTFRAGVCYGLGARAQVSNYLSASVGGSLEQCKVGNFGRSAVKTRGLWFGPPVPSAACFGVLLYAFGAGASSSDTYPEVSSPQDAEGLLYVLGAISSLLAVITDVRHYEDSALPSSFSVLGFNLLEVGAGDEDFCNRINPATPYLREKFFVEVGATAGAVGFDAGFNPVELVDFLLGWLTIDLTGDDGETPKTRFCRKSGEELAGLLSDENAATRISAVQELGRRRESAGIETLLRLLKDDLSEVRCAASEALGRIRSDKAVTALIDVVNKDKHELVRCCAIEALGDTGNGQAVETLIKQLKHTKGYVHFYASEALSKITGKDFGADYARWEAWYEKGKEK